MPRSFPDYFNPAQHGILALSILLKVIPGFVCHMIKCNPGGF